MIVHRINGPRSVYQSMIMVLLVLFVYGCLFASAESDITGLTSPFEGAPGILFSEENETNFDVGDGTDEGSTGGGTTPLVPSNLGSSHTGTLPIIPPQNESFPDSNFDVGDGTDEGSTGGNPPVSNPLTALIPLANSELDFNRNTNIFPITFQEVHDRLGKWIVGVFRGRLAFKFGSLESYDNDIFVVRTNPIGDVLWADSLRGDGDEALHQVQMCGNGDLLISGMFTRNLESLPPSSGLADVFVGRITPNGDLVWIQQIASSGYATVVGLKEGTSGEVVVALRQSDGDVIYEVLIEGPDKFPVSND